MIDRDFHLFHEQYQFYVSNQMMVYNEGKNFRQINLEKSNLDKEGRKLLLSKMGTIMDTISQLLNLWLKLCQNGNYRKNNTSFRKQKYEKSNNHKANKNKR